MRRAWRFAIALASVVVACASAAFAQDVTLRSADGGISLSGRLIGYDGEFYRLETVFGPLTVDGSALECTGEGCPDPSAFVAELRFSGSDHMGALLLPALVEAFAERSGLVARRVVEDEEHFRYELSAGEPEWLRGVFHFRLSTTAEGFADLIAGETDFVMALRAPDAGELRRARDVGQGDLEGPRRSRVIALDALVPVVAVANEAQAIAIDDLRERLRTASAEAPVVLPPEGHPLREAVSRIGPISEEAAQTSERLSAVAVDVATQPDALGLTSWSLRSASRLLPIAGACGLRVTATPESVRSGTYPFAAPLILYSAQGRLPRLGRDFETFLTGRTAQRVVARAGFIDQGRRTTALSQSGERLIAALIRARENDVSLLELERMVETLRDRRVLSLTFRFEPGSSRLTLRSRENVALLARDLEAGLHDGSSLMFVGFSDATGNAGQNLRLSERRAESVRQAVERAALTADFTRVDMVSNAFGEAMPLACDDSDWGREANRRVEVWIGPRGEVQR